MEVLNEFCHRAWWMRLICGGSPIKLSGFETIQNLRTISGLHILRNDRCHQVSKKSRLTFRNCAEKPPKYTFYVQIIILSIFSLFTRKHTLNRQIRSQKTSIQVIKDVLCTYFTCTSHPYTWTKACPQANIEHKYTIKTKQKGNTRQFSNNTPQRTQSDERMKEDRSQNVFSYGT